MIFIDTSSEYIWPIPGYARISSYFGKRSAPTAGAATYHTGIDIPAPEGTSLFAVCDGKITFTGFLGGGGYTITLTSIHGNIKFTYCHVSPNYIVSEGDNIYKGELIGNVGPKYVYGVLGNQYSDEKGIPTNGATTGCHLHFGYRIDGKYANPLDLFQNSLSMIFEYFTKKRLYFISEYFTYVQSWTSPLAAGQAQDLIFVLNFVFWLILSLGDRFNYDALASFR